MLRKIEQAHAAQSAGGKFPQRRHVRAALDEMIPELAFERAGNFARGGGDARDLHHFGLPVTAFIGLLFPIGNSA